MRKVRNNTFETNSSSTHAIVMCKDKINHKDNYISNSSKYIEVDYDWFEDEETKETVRLDSPSVRDTDETEYGIYFERTEYSELSNPIDKILFIYAMLDRLMPNARKVAFKKNVIKSFNYIKDNNLSKIYDEDLDERFLNKLFRMMDDMLNEKYYRGMYYLDEIDKKNLDTEQDTFWSLGTRKKKTNDLKVELGGDFKDLDGIKTEFRKMLTYENTMNLIWNSNSYISLGGDEYHGFFIKRVGFEYDYNCEKDFKERVKQETKNYKVIFCDWG